MENIKVDRITAFNIICSGIIYQDNEIIKFDSNGVDTLLRIDENKEALTQELYALPLKIYKNPLGIPFAHSMINYSDHELLVYQKGAIEKQKVIEKIVFILKELENIGIVYWDVHTKNFLIKDNSFKIIDLDEAFVKITNRGLISRQYNLVNLILELYLYENIFYPTSRLTNLLKRIKIEDYFSKEVCEYLEAVHHKSKEIIGVEVVPLITDLEDLDRTKKILGKIRG